MTSPDLASALAGELLGRIASREATVGICGLGYVGLPLAAAAADAGFPVLGFDTDSEKPRKIAAGESYIGAVTSDRLASLVAAGRLSASTDFSRLEECDVIVICVPTPLTRQREPDLSYVEATARAIAAALRPGQVVVLESTTYPGTTTGILRPILERHGLKSGQDFFLGFSPEREDPGNDKFRTETIPKIVSGDGPDALRIVEAFYSAVVEKVVAVSSPDVAEAVKITENVFRAVNIALANELKVIFSAMDIDVWEVIDAAKTKPFGYMPFYPGPGLGGHCIPIDPFYLTWKAREFDIATRFIELAGEINRAMPRYVIEALEKGLDKHLGLSLGSARVLIVGLAYKKDVSDIRESPSLKLIEFLEDRGTRVDFHDPHVPEIPQTREHAALAGRKSIGLDAELVAGYDAVVIATDHSTIDYGLVSERSRLIVDTRNAIASRGLSVANVVKA